jgi:hypothetical protein
MLPPSTEPTTMLAFPPGLLAKAMNPDGPGGGVIATEAGADASTDAGALAVASADADGGADAWAEVEGLGVAAPPPKNPVRNSKPMTATMPTAAIAIAGPALSGRPERATGSGATACVEAGASSVAQFWQKTRSGGLTVPQDGQVIPAGVGGGNGGTGVAIGWVSVVAADVPSGTGGAGVGVGAGVGAGAPGSFSPVHSRKLPQEPQKLAPASFSNPHVLQVINWRPPRLSDARSVTVV